MTKEEIIIASHKEFAHQIEIGSKAPLSVQEGFVKGAEWMQEKMIENPDGGALLYAVEKTAERTRKETLLEVLNWIEGMYDTDYVAGDIVRMLKDKLKKK